MTTVFQAHIKEPSKFCVTGLCDGDTPVTGEFPSRRASNAENISIIILVALFVGNSRVAGHFEYEYVDIK